MEYQFTKNEVNIDQLTLQITQSSIVTALDYITKTGSNLVVKFKATLSHTDETTLNTIVSNHTPVATTEEPLPVEIVQPKDASGVPIIKSMPFTDAAGFRFRGVSFSGTATAEATTDIDFQITQERYINGGRLLVSDIGDNDKITFQVVDKDNILGFGAGVVLDEFIKDYFVPTSGNLEVRLDYPAKLIAGLYLRLKYTNSRTSNSSIKCNLYLHWKAS